MRSEPLLTLSGISKTFGALKALDDVSLDIAAGEVHCLLGENGAGKSTLCNIVFGVYQPDAGAMRLAGSPHVPAGPADALAHGVAMVHQHFSLVPDLTVVDNLLLGQARGVLRRKQCAAQVERLSVRYGLALQPFAVVQDLSVGERQRVEIVKCLMREPRLLVLDEPTAVLLPEEIDGLLSVCERVAREGCSVVLVTHKMAEVKRVANRVTVLRGGRVVARSDQPANDIDALVRAMIQRDLAADSAAVSALLAAKPAQRRAQEPVLRISGLRVVDAQGATRIDGVELDVHAGEIVGIAGVEGNGQSELGAVLAGMTPPTSGTFRVNGQDLTGKPPARVTEAGVGVVPEDRHLVGCVTGMTVAENLCLARLREFKHFGIADRGAMRAHAQERMQAFDVRAAGPDALFSSLSGGNQQKAVLARELAVPNLALLVAAQPTRGLDVGAVESIYGHIRNAAEAGAGVLLISSELEELLIVAHRIVVMYRGRLVGECEANLGNRERIGAWMAGHAA